MCFSFCLLFFFQQAFINQTCNTRFPGWIIGNLKKSKVWFLRKIICHDVVYGNPWRGMAFYDRAFLASTMTWKVVCHDVVAVAAHAHDLLGFFRI